MPLQNVNPRRLRYPPTLQVPLLTAPKSTAKRLLYTKLGNVEVVVVFVRGLAHGRGRHDGDAVVQLTLVHLAEVAVSIAADIIGAAPYSDLPQEDGRVSGCDTFVHTPRAQVDAASAVNTAAVLMPDHK